MEMKKSHDYESWILKKNHEKTGFQVVFPQKRCFLENPSFQLCFQKKHVFLCFFWKKGKKQFSLVFSRKTRFFLERPLFSLVFSNSNRNNECIFVRYSWGRNNFPIGKWKKVLIMYQGFWKKNLKKSGWQVVFPQKPCFL